jgi:ISXO2-like transposase domain
MSRVGSDACGCAGCLMPRSRVSYRSCEKRSSPARKCEPMAGPATTGWSNMGTYATRQYFRHQATPLTCPCRQCTPVSSLLKRWLLGTHQGAVRPDQLDRYLDEFTFRFNRRSSRSRGLLFYRLLEQAVVTSPAPYRFIVGGKP